MADGGWPRDGRLSPCDLGARSLRAPSVYALGSAHRLMSEQTMQCRDREDNAMSKGERREDERGKMGKWVRGGEEGKEGMRGRREGYAGDEGGR